MTGFRIPHRKSAAVCRLQKIGKKIMTGKALVAVTLKPLPP